MLQTDDIGRLFAVLQAEYGYKWAHKADAIPVWQEKLRSFDVKQVMRAAAAAPDLYPDNPPTVGQLLAILRREKPRANTYLPAPKLSTANRNANMALFRVLMKLGGIDAHQLQLCVHYKNALVEDLDGEPDREWLQHCHDELMGLARSYDAKKRSVEMEIARERFRVRQGITGPMWAA